MSFFNKDDYYDRAIENLRIDMNDIKKSYVWIKHNNDQIKWEEGGYSIVYSFEDILTHTMVRIKDESKQI